MAFDQVRVRVAPSPTGDPHVGTAYVTLFNYILAKKNGGSLVLRIEDTDQSRAKSTSEQQIYDSLSWLGLNWDEGPDRGGAYGPYKQSERKSIYVEHCMNLVEKGAAYHCFCTSERLKEVKEEKKKTGGMLGYDGHCRNLSPEVVQHNLKNSMPFVIRLATPQEGEVSFRDELRGEITFNSQQIDDQVLLKSDGFPTYHLANVVDDHLMKISHVMRAEEWISSTPKHVLLYDAFGWEKPQFIHLPLLRNTDKSKISKRKNPVSINYYQRKGILPEAMVNFLGLMGWSYDEKEEIFNLDQMLDRFDLKDIHLGGPVFDQKKLLHINQNYLARMNQDQFVSFLQEKLFAKEYLTNLYELFKDRLECFEDFVDKANFFFNGALSYEGLEITPKAIEPSEFSKMLKELVLKLDDLYDWYEEEIQTLMDDHRKEIDWKPRNYFMPVRLIVTGRKDSPPLAKTIEVLGREIVRFRIRDFLEKIAL